MLAAVAKTAIVITLFAVCAMPAFAQSLHPAFAGVSEEAVSIPIGHANFCKARPVECTPNNSVLGVTILTEADWRQLVDVNSAVNANIVAVTDQDLYQTEEFWTYPNGFGDCEDFALEKRRQLIALGWAPSTLLLTVVRQANGEGHAVLLVRTDRGDLVLDNQTGSIELWTDTPYQFIKRQSQADAGKWVSFVDQNRIMVATNR